MESVPMVQDCASSGLTLAPSYFREPLLCSVKAGDSSVW